MVPDASLLATASISSRFGPPLKALCAEGMEGNRGGNGARDARAMGPLLLVILTLCGP